MGIMYCGIDLSLSSTGLAVVEYLGDSKFKLIDKKTIAPPRTPQNPFNRKVESLKLFQFANESLTPYKESKFFVFENYSFGSSGKLTELAELGGIYRFYINTALNKPFDVIAPQSVKKIITGSGRSDKLQVRIGLNNFIENIDDFVFSNYDESDAAAVAVAYGIKMEKEQENHNQKQQK